MVLPVRIAGIALLLTSMAVGAAQSIEVAITTHLGDRQEFAEGDEISFFLSLDHDAYIYLFYLDADARLLQLLPNRNMPDHHFPAGLFMPLPNAEQAYRFTVAPPFGEEQMLVFASDRADLELAGETLDNGLKRIADNIDQLGAMFRRASGRAYGQSILSLSTTAADRVPGSGEDL